LAVPEGRVVALVGPDAAGKTTLLNLAAGLRQRWRASDSWTRMPGCTRTCPLPMLRLAWDLNQAWDVAGAADRIASLDIPLTRKVGALSGGQQSQLALTIALAKQPRLLILDEPLARLDPVARHDFMALLMAAAAEHGLPVIFFSHVVAELDHVADYLIVLNRGWLQIAADVEDLLASHVVLTGPVSETGPLRERVCVVAETVAGAQAHLLVRVPRPEWAVPAGFRAGTAGLEELVMAYLRRPGVGVLPGPEGLAGGRHIAADAAAAAEVLR
jgi:ABC-2 type transport system ATP-binding protein